MTRYAEGTRVSVASSRGEITGILAKHGCQRMAWGTEPLGDTLQFELGGHMFRFAITKPTREELTARLRHEGRDPSRVMNWAVKVDQEWMRRWRAHVLLIKAKLEFIEGGAGARHICRVHNCRAWIRLRSGGRTFGRNEPTVQLAAEHLLGKLRGRA